MVGAFLKAAALLVVALVVASGCQGVREFGPADFACHYGGYCVGVGPDVFGGLDGGVSSDGAGSDAVGGPCDVADCDDGNPCTADSCLAVGGCQHADNQAPCEDGNPCTLKDVCAAGACNSGGLAACADAFDCTSDSCDPILGCVHTPVDSFCDDGSPCTVGSCAKVPGTSSGCKSVPVQDGSACKGGSCQAGVCAGGECGDGTCGAGESAVNCPADCGASAVCGDGACNSGETLASCPQDCKASSVCGNAKCESGETKVNCSKDCECDGDGDCAAVVDTCNTGVCASGKCVKKAKVGGCDDGDPCTANDTCAGGACVGTAKDCSGLNDVCVVGVCQGGACVGKPANNGGKCEDGNLCTLGDVCGSGGCLAGTLKLCNDADLCTDDSCSPVAGVCVFVPIAGCNGNCVVAGNCDDSNPCTDDSCVGGKCKSVGNTAGCSDGDACTAGDVCKNGTCMAGAAKGCDDGKPCTADSCSAATGACASEVKVGAVCDDGDACTAGDSCGPLGCVGAALKCDDGNSCTSDGCSGGACTKTSLADGAACSDGKACTTESCKSGSCQAVPVVCGANASCVAPGGCVCGAGFVGDGKVCTAAGLNAVGCGADGLACGGGKGACSSGHCFWTDAKGYKWTLVPAGVFWMGCPKTGMGCAAADTPQHQVYVSAYWVGVYEVSVANYKACSDVGGSGCTLPVVEAAYANWTGKEQHPVNWVKWGQSQNYCKWLGGDLPTEAQWEKAARGGCELYASNECQTSEPLYPWGNSAPVCGQNSVYNAKFGCGIDSTYPVGTGSAQGTSPYGTYDMAGNVAEFTLDWFDAKFYTKAAATEKDPVNSIIGSYTVSRGGSFQSVYEAQLLASHRAATPIDGGSFDGFGIRCAKSYP
jgi:formylglycine-generating enzyme required for sulfatase activity